ncbi:MAG: PTS galactosamine/N-acetylgalactosamine transporter subunit IIA [Breznakia sp.]
MVGIIITGHGNFGSGLTSSLKLIAGEPQAYETVDFIEAYSTEDLDRELRAAIDRLDDCEGIIVLSDLPGGSPFKTAVMITQDYKKPIEVIAGTNLPMLIELSMARTMMEDMSMLVAMALNTGKEQVVKFEMKTPKTKVANDDEGGI